MLHGQKPVFKTYDSHVRAQCSAVGKRTYERVRASCSLFCAAEKYCNGIGKLLKERGTSSEALPNGVKCLEVKCFQNSKKIENNF